MDKLTVLRNNIDTLDEELLHLLVKRLEVIKQVGKIKKELNLPALDANRWGQVLEKNIAKGQQLGLNGEFVKQILDTIHMQALDIEEDIKNDK